jgi:hypothetical protein
MNARPLHPGHDADIAYELIITAAGTASLTCGGEVLWVSDGDDDYAEEFDDEYIDITDEAQCEDVISWLTAQGYIPPRVPVSIIADEDGGLLDANL